MLFPLLQCIHILGITLVVGTIAIVDLHLLGFGIRRDTIADDLAPWTAAGLLTVWVTGPLLFGADWGRYVKNPAFLLKMVILAVALLTHFTIRRRVTKHRKIAAVVSLVLWTCVILAGRAIADFDIQTSGTERRSDSPLLLKELEIPRIEPRSGCRRRLQPVAGAAASQPQHEATAAIAARDRLKPAPTRFAFLFMRPGPQASTAEREGNVA